MKNRLLLIIWFVSLVSLARAQHTNSWIDFNQRYFKIKIAEDGVYRISQAQLAAASIPINTPAQRFQMFRRGEEVAIRVESSGGNVSAIEFYGQKNRGEGDAELYRSPDLQPHDNYSLYTDTAAYFLTWKLTGTGKRMSNDASLTSTTEEPYHLAEIFNLETANYSDGQKYGSNNDLASGLFDEGEGWTSARKTKNGIFTYTLNLTNMVNSAGVNPMLELLLTGRNNLAHDAEISIGPSGTALRKLDTASGFSGHETYLFNKEIQWSDISASGLCVVQIKVLGIGAADAQSVSYLKLTYPQTFGMGSSNQKLYTLRAKSTGRSYVRIPTTSALRVFDVTDPFTPFTRQTTSNSESVFFTVEDPSQSREVLAVTTTKSAPSLKEVLFEPLDPRTSDYLIVSHSALMKSASDGLNPVQAYADYREQDFSVEVAEVRNIYDQFNYGDPSALAIKNYLKYAISNETIPKYLLLIGKGTTLNEAFHRDPFYRISGLPVTPMVHYVPTYGYPGSDALFSVGIRENSEPLIATGRVNALTPEDVKSYLDKVKEMEALDYDALWRKRIVQLSGGQNFIELNTFARYIRNFQQIAESDYLGGKCLNVGKSSSDAVEFIDVTQEVNNGIGMITFFGHSSSSATDIEIGKVPSERGYTNSGRYPIILMNGCNGGAIFGLTVSFGEEWIKAKGLGAVSVIAHSDFALSGSLRRFSDLFYEIAYGRAGTFGLPQGEIIRAAQEEYLTSYGHSDESYSQIYGTLLQGDPAYAPFGATAPDYATSNDQVSAKSLSGDHIVASAPGFSIDIVVSNFGRTVEDSLTVRVDRTLADGTAVAYEQKFQRPLYQHTLTFAVENDPVLKNDGENLFVVTLDPADSVQELDEANNTASFSLFIPKGNTINLYPINMGVTSGDQVDFTWQSADLLSDRRLYSFTLDTSAHFNSPALQTDELEGELLLRKRVDLSLLPDSTTVYWRTRFAEALSGEDTSWVTSSFTIISEEISGWGQFKDEQIRENLFTGISYNESTRKWEFLETSIPVRVNNHAANNANGYEYEDMRVVINGDDYLITDNATADTLCKVNSFNAVVFDKESTLPIRPFGFGSPDISNPLVCGQVPQMIHNFDATNIQNDLLDSLIKLIDVGDAILLFSFDSVAYSTWDTRLKESLASVGVSTATINGLADGQPAIFLGKKGLAEGEAVEIINNGSGLPVRQQALEFDGEVTGVYSSGEIKSGRIGPAKNWTQFTYDLAELGDDNVFMIVDGITSQDQKVNLFYEDPTDTIRLNEVDAREYPYIDVRFLFSDNDNQRPPQLLNWAATYDLPAEGVLVADNKQAEELQEGAPFERSFRFINISETDFSDSLDLDMRLINVSTSNSTQSKRIEGPAAGDTATFTSTFNTIGKAGSNNLSVSVRPLEVEQYSSNNTLNFGNILQVNEDETNPLLDVTFDGIYILDGDIVSPSPRILIKLRDDNPYLFKEDTSGIQISLKSPCEGCDYERVNMISAEVTYTPASEGQDFEIEYRPGPLENGVYYLRAQGADESGNDAGTEPYEISFEVINESTITHFYPYPNPFSTSTRFVFTLTGSQMPDEVKIQIMTVSGRVVREITQDEIGPLKIGTNITQYAWDGRDEFGDRLANGVYLYKVFVRQSGEKVQHRVTSGDRAFKHGFGKIYLLR